MWRFCLIFKEIYIKKSKKRKISPHKRAKFPLTQVIFGTFDEFGVFDAPKIMLVGYHALTDKVVTVAVAQNAGGLLDRSEISFGPFEKILGQIALWVFKNVRRTAHHLLGVPGSTCGPKDGDSRVAECSYRTGTSIDKSLLRAKLIQQYGLVASREHVCGKQHCCIIAVAYDWLRADEYNRIVFVIVV